MSALKAIKGFIKESWACINEGGSPLTSEWKPDEGLRRAVQKYDGSADIQGSMFLDDLKEFYDAMDNFNATRDSERRFKLVVHEKIADDVESNVMGERSSLLGLASVTHLALERNGRVYPGRWFSDMAYSSGFVFTMHGSETKFLCGLEKRTDFGNFAFRLLNPPPPYPHPVIPRMV